MGNVKYLKLMMMKISASSLCSWCSISTATWYDWLHFGCILGLVFVMSGFGQGIHGVPIFAFLLQILLLYTVYLIPPSSFFLGYLAIWLIFGGGTVIAFLHAFGFQTVSLFMTFGISFVYALIMIAFVLFPVGELRRKLVLQCFPRLHILTYPILVTGTFTFFGEIVPAGSLLNSAYIASRGFTSLRLFGSFFGVPGITFAVSWTCSMIVELLEISGLLWENEVLVEYVRRRSVVEEDWEFQNDGERSQEEEKDEEKGETKKQRSPYSRLCGPGLALLLSLLIVLTYGGSKAINSYGQFFQKDVTELTWSPSVITFSCFIGDSNLFSGDGGTSTLGEGYIKEDLVQAYNEMLVQNTEDMLMRIPNSDIALWSEGYAKVFSDDDENYLLNLCAKTANKTRTVFGVSYIRIYPDPGPSPSYNSTTSRASKLALFQPDGELSWIYQKANPIVGIEGSIVVPGIKGPPKMVDFGARYSTIGAAIGWDYVFPDYIRIAAARNQTHAPDIMLNPSWDWGTIGFYLDEISSFRALENGFTMLRCAAGGVSSVIDPYGNTVFRKITTRMDSGFTVEIPRLKRVSTIYSVTGELFGWVCFVLTLVALLCSLVPASVLLDCTQRLSCKKRQT